MNVYMDDDLYELYSTGNNRKYKEIARNAELKGGFDRAIRSMMAVNRVDELRSLSFLHYERLKYQLEGLSSVRLSNRYVHRLLFEEREEGIAVKLIEIDNSHYGNRK